MFQTSSHIILTLKAILVATSDLYLRNFILRNELQTEAASKNLTLSFPIPVYVRAFDHKYVFLHTRSYLNGRQYVYPFKQVAVFRSS
jgi:hypothetical protein